MKTFIPALIKANLLAHGLFFFLSGMLGSIDTEGKLASIGLSASNYEGIAAFKVIYGGLMTAIGALFLAGFLLKAMERFSLLAVAIVMVALIISRLTALLSSETIPTNYLLYMTIEICELVLTAILLRVSANRWSAR